MSNALPYAWLSRGNVIPAYVGSQIRGNRLVSRVRGNDYEAARAVYCTPLRQDCGQQGKRTASTFLILQVTIVATQV